MLVHCALLVAGISWSLSVPTSAGQDSEPARGAEYEVFYHHTLRNKTEHPLEDVKIYLPIPVDGDGQKVRELVIETGGRNFEVSERTDVFGTQLRRISIPRIEAGTEVRTGFSCIVELSTPDKIDLDPTRAASLDEIPKDVRDHFTADDRIFDLKNEIVRSMSAALVREHPRPIERVKAIHDLVASKLAYRLEDGWDPAPVVLTRGSGSDSEFAYVFCALCRASGIPTRLVGASIFPLKSSSPFEDRSWHRWAEAYLPGYGWVPFDPRLDRAQPPRTEFVGAHHPRVLVLTRIGSRSQQLGLAYVGANTHASETTRTQSFTWSQGTRARLAAARALVAEKKSVEAKQAFEHLVAVYPGTRAAEEAEVELVKLRLVPSKAR